MKYNHKQLAYSAGKISENMIAIAKRMAIITFMLFFVQAVCFAFGDPSGSVVVVEMGIPFIILLTMANIGNITQPNDRDTAGNQLGFKLWLTAREQIDTTVEFPLPNANREIGTTPLKAGEYQHYFEGVENSLKYSATGERGDITSTFGNTFTIIIRYSAAALNFLEQFQGTPFVLNYKECEDATIYQLGTYCKGLTLKNHEVKKDGDGKYISLTFSNAHWRKEMILTGNLTEQDPVTIVAGATELAIVTGNNNYLLSDHVAVATIATVSGIADADEDRYITVKAPGVVTNAPKISDNAVFILKGGEDWIANPGSQIIFRVLDSTSLVEVSRIQTA